MRFKSVSRTDVGLKRKINEDAVLAAPDRALWVVADGMGGHDAGEVASAMVADAMRALPPSDNIDATVDAAIAALSNVNDALIQLARTTRSERTIGTTVVGLTIGDGGYRCFWAGDSRAYHMRNGQVTRISRDHSLVQDLVDAGMLTQEQAEKHESSNVITRAIGVAEDVRVDVVSGDALPGDQFVLASDGLTRCVSDEELAAELGRHPPEQAADNLVRTVLSRGAPDNVSLVIAKVL